jgi:triosephosphate isomerase
MKNLVFAYEPIWAIGTGQEATPEMAQAVHHHLKDKMATKGSNCPSILYGGSVKAENVSGLLAMPDIDGVLVGGASLDPEGFAALCVNAGQG